MFDWLRRRCEAARRDAKDANRLRKRSDLAELPADPDPLDELMRIVGECEGSGRGARARQDFRSRRPRVALRSRLPRR